MLPENGANLHQGQSCAVPFRAEHLLVHISMLPENGANLHQGLPRKGSSRMGSAKRFHSTPQALRVCRHVSLVCLELSGLLCLDSSGLLQGAGGLGNLLAKLSDFRLQLRNLRGVGLNLRCELLDAC